MVPWMRSWAVVVLLACAVTGCNGEPEPQFGSPTPSASSATATPQPTLSTSAPSATGAPGPVLPPTANEKSDRGARAFTKYWIKLVNYGQSSGDVKTLQSVMNAKEEGCQGIIRAISSPYADGGHIEGGRWRLTRLRQLPLDHGADWAGFAEVTTKPQLVYDAAGGATRYPGGDYYVYIYLIWNDGRWSVTWVRSVTPRD